jgi:hypothetical protein
MDVMIDIESLGTKPGAVILSIAAVCFDPAAATVGKGFYTGISIEDSQTHGLTIDAKTLSWWMSQSHQARNFAFAGVNHLPVSLDRLTDFMRTESAATFWAHSPSFDMALLEAAYSATGRQPPWSYRDLRDTRTLYALADFWPKDIVEPAAVAHHALDDAVMQARAAIVAMGRLSVKQAA